LGLIYKKQLMMKRIKSFSVAFKGIGLLFKSQVNARIHLIATILVIILGCLFKISIIEWLVISLCIGLVLSLEAINSAIEILCDKIEPNQDEFIGKVKDLSAGGVLIGAIIAAIAGCIIFLPKIIHLLCF